MGTNFYACKIPSGERIIELYDLLVESNNFNRIIEEINKTYGHFDIDYDGNPSGGKIHLGKRSGGWKFLWDPNIYIIKNGHTEWVDNGDGSKSGHFVRDPDTYFSLYPLTKQGILDFINQDDILIYDEYGKFYSDKEGWFNECVNWNTWNGKEAWDSKSYNIWEREKNSNYRPFICRGELIDKLKSDGYKMICDDNSDFYSDGLRFATSTDFS